MVEVFTVNSYQVPFVFFWVFTILITQLTVWLIGRNDIDAEWWRAGFFGLIASVLLRFVAFSAQANGVLGIILCLVVTMILLWVLAGYFYQIAGWRRLMLSALCIGCVLLALLVKFFSEALLN
ncbi:hypothetical protein OAL55_04635 [Verrucomicrobiales bacterium]|jgi:hypothetical protein|nr:hypothetical protein [bacterium]MDC0322625.1 hypothetical protein [Verrucomicrobiales bacterium]